MPSVASNMAPLCGFKMCESNSRSPGFLATVASQILLRHLTPASGRQDHTTSPSASVPFVIGTISVHRIPPRVRDDREPPLCVGRDDGNMQVICVGRERKYFLKEGWTGRHSLIWFNKIAPTLKSGQARGRSTPRCRNYRVSLVGCGPVSIEGRRKPAVPKYDRRLVIVVAHLGVAG
jgi:hypothetical protein